MIYGLGAALGWGFADYGAAVAGRRLGSFVALLLAQLAGALGVTLMVVAVRPAWNVPAGQVALLVVNGVVAAGAYVFLYRGLTLGPVALVSPIVAAFAVVTILLALVVLHESLAASVLLGAAVTVTGVVLTSTDPRSVASGRRMHHDGVPPALLSLVMFGVAAFILGESSQRVGWLPALAISRVATLAVLSAGAAILQPARPRDRGGALFAVGVGFLDVLGAAAYARGSEIGLVSIVTAASATFPLISVAGGVVLLHERPALSQVAGVVIVIGGLLLLATGR